MMTFSRSWLLNDVCVCMCVLFIYTNFIIIAMCMCPVRYMCIRMYIYAPLFNYCNNKKKHDDVVIAAVVAIQESR